MKSADNLTPERQDVVYVAIRRARPYNLIKKAAVNPFRGRLPNFEFFSQAFSLLKGSATRRFSPTPVLFLLCNSSALTAVMLAYSPLRHVTIYTWDTSKITPQP